MNRKSKVPQLRFPEFTDVWEQCKLGDIFTQTVNYVNPKEQNLELWSLTVQDGLTQKTERYNREFITKKEDKYKEVKVGEIVYNPMNMTLGAIDVNNVGKSVAVSGYYITMSASQESDPYFIQTWMKSPLAILLYKNNATGTLKEKQRVQFPTLSKIASVIPSKEEQTKIGTFFKSLDNLITLHQRKLDNLNSIKKSMLDKLFPKKGEKYPDVRFEGFTGEWEQRKLGDSLTFLKDGTHGTHADVNDGPLLLSAKNIKDGIIKWDETDRRISQDEYKKIHSKFVLEKGDVLLTIVGSIGETAILQDAEGLTFQRSVAFLRPCKDITSEFLYTEIQTDAFQKELESRKSTSAQPGIYLGDLAEIPINIAPNKEEQRKIGEFFGHINNLITLHQRKLDNLYNIKKGFLQQMFV